MAAKKLDQRTREIAKIWVGAKSLNIESDDLHFLVKQLTKKDSIADLSATERARVIFDLQTKGAYTYRKGRTANAPRPAKPRSERGAGTDLVTPAQQTYIDGLWERLAEAEENAASIPWREAFTYRIISRKWPQARWEASKLIEALKKRIRQD